MQKFELEFDKFCALGTLRCQKIGRRPVKTFVIWMVAIFKSFLLAVDWPAVEPFLLTSFLYTRELTFLVLRSLVLKGSICPPGCCCLALSEGFNSRYHSVEA